MTDEAPVHHSRRSLLQAGTLVLLLGAQQIARGASIVAVRVWPSQDYSRVTIESDQRLVTRHTFVETPPRLAVDIEGIDLNPQLKELVAKIRPDDPNIAGIRVGQNAPGVVRMVMDLKHAARPQVFTLTPVAAYQFRLVFDLYPAQARDPLEALIAERLNDPKATVAEAPAPIDTPAGTPSAHDPLGDLIAQRSEKPLQDRRGRRTGTCTAAAARSRAAARCHAGSVTRGDCIRPTACALARPGSSQGALGCAPHRPPDHRGARPGPRRRRPWRHRPERHAREGHRAQDRPPAA